MSTALYSMISPPPFGIDVLRSDSPSARADIGCVTIRANGTVLTRLIDERTGGQVRDFARLPVSLLALWWAENWWRMRYEAYPIGYAPTVSWRMAHELTSISGGTRWPPIAFYASGDRMVASALAGISAVPGPTRYLDITTSSVDGLTYESTIDAFLNVVVENYSCPEDQNILRPLLRQLNEERGQPEFAAWRKLEALLGFDVDEAPEELLQTLARYEVRVGSTGIEEACAAAPGEEAAKSLSDALEATNASEIQIDVSSAVNIANVGARPSSETLPWQLAEHAAHALRQRIGMPHGPIRAQALSQVLGVKWAELLEAPATAAHVPYGATLSYEGVSRRCALRSSRGQSAQRRFELARALGDAVWDPNSMFVPLSRARTDRQKFQRAFAQSFLCPFDDLSALLDTTVPTEDDVAKAAKHFHVSQGVVRTVLVNKHLLPRQTLDDIVEAA